MAVPKVTDQVISAEDNGFRVSGIYDIALVWKSAGRDYKVVPNDFCFGQPPFFFCGNRP